MKVIGLLSVILLGVTSCAPAARTFKAYEGPDEPASSLSLVHEDTKSLYRTIILDIDDYTIEKPSESRDLTTIAVRPGFHRLKVRTQTESSMSRSWRDGDIQAILEAGKSYVVQAPGQGNLSLVEHGSGEFISGYYFEGRSIKRGTCDKASCWHDEYEARGMRESARWYKRSCVKGKACSSWVEHSIKIPGTFAPW